MSMLKCCLNWKVLVGLGVVAAGFWLIQPSLFAAAFPFLILLICPLSMGFMMFGTGNKGGMQDTATGAVQQGQQYTCPMHPEVRAAGPGSCPTCGMALVPVAPTKPARVELRVDGGSALRREQQLADLRGELHQMGEQQAALRRRLEELGAGQEETAQPNSAVREAEQVARAADLRR